MHETDEAPKNSKPNINGLQILYTVTEELDTTISTSRLGVNTIVEQSK